MFGGVFAVFGKDEHCGGSAHEGERGRVWQTRGAGKKKVEKKRTQQLFFNEWMKQTEDLFFGFLVVMVLWGSLRSLFHSFFFSIFLRRMHTFFHSFLCFLSLNRTPLAHTYVAYSPSRRARDVTNMAQL